MPARPRLQRLSFVVEDQKRKPLVESEESRPANAPRSPQWLPEDAAKLWRRTVRIMIDAGTWHPAFSDTLASYVVLEAQFRADIEGFPVTKMVQKRLLAADLGLVPSNFGKVQKAANTYGGRTNKFMKFIP